MQHTLQHTATHTATHCNTLQHPATKHHTLFHMTLPGTGSESCHTVTYCNALLHPATHCNCVAGCNSLLQYLQRTITSCNTHCNTLQHPATKHHTLFHVTLPGTGRESCHTVTYCISFAKEPYKRDYILQKRPIILRSLLIVATPYLGPLTVEKLCRTYE